MPRLGLSIRGCWLSYANTIPLAYNVRCQIWATVDALTKTFHSLTTGARVLLLGYVVINLQHVRRLPVRERSSPKKYITNQTMQLQFVPSAWLMLYSGTTRMPFAKANVLSSCRRLAKTPLKAQR